MSRRNNRAIASYRSNYPREDRSFTVGTLLAIILAAFVAFAIVGSVAWVHDHVPTMAAAGH